MTSDLTNLQAALINEWTWKTTSMRDMTLSVCRLALRVGITGKFSALDLPMHGEIAQGGSGIAGSVFRSLVESGIIAPVGVLLADGAFFQERVRNAGGNPVGVWRIRHPGMARALVRAHAPAEIVEPKQMEFRPDSRCRGALVAAPEAA